MAGQAAPLAPKPPSQFITGHPSAPEYWWLYALLLSTMIPSLVNLVIGGTEELLRAEGFTDIRYVDTATATESANAIGAGQADFGFDFASAYIMGSIRARR